MHVDPLNEVWINHPRQAPSDQPRFKAHWPSIGHLAFTEIVVFRSLNIRFVFVLATALIVFFPNFAVFRRAMVENLYHYAYSRCLPFEPAASPNKLPRHHGLTGLPRTFLSRKPGKAAVGHKQGNNSKSPLMIPSKKSNI